jgi:hypothetical protein
MMRKSQPSQGRCPSGKALTPGYLGKYETPFHTWKNIPAGGKPLPQARLLTWSFS